MMNERDRRNLNPIPEARLAMVLWGKEYSEQMGGCMDFWDKISEARKDIVRELIRDIEFRLLERKLR